MADYRLRIIKIADEQYRIEINSKVGHVPGKTLPYSISAKAKEFYPVYWNVWSGQQPVEVELGLWEVSDYVGVDVHYEATDLKQLKFASRPGGTDILFDVVYYKEGEAQTLATDVDSFTWSPAIVDGWLPQSPFLGPPLPRFLGFLWPWAGG